MNEPRCVCRQVLSHEKPEGKSFALGGGATAAAAGGRRLSAVETWQNVHKNIFSVQQNPRRFVQHGSLKRHQNDKMIKCVIPGGALELRRDDGSFILSCDVEKLEVFNPLSFFCFFF